MDISIGISSPVVFVFRLSYWQELTKNSMATITTKAQRRRLRDVQ